MDLINEKLLIDLYSKYINDNQYVFYKEHATIIIMQKLTDDITCISDIQPKKYHSGNLKVIIMFDLTDPYKLVYDLPQYKINDVVNSYYYESIKEAYTLTQKYDILTNHKMCEYNYVDGVKNGLYQEYYESGQILMECYYSNSILNGTFRAVRILNAVFNDKKNINHTALLIEEFLNSK